ncbi:MAG: LysR substrate-binding domain-containing protein [Pseudomonadota bacterium]
MDLNALASFVAAAETLNFSQAAERRNTVQSAVSAQIRKLEDELGQTLFDRGRGRPIRLTAQGRALLTYAQRILDLSAEAADALRADRGDGALRLGVTVTLALSVVARALPAFAERHPRVRVHIHCDRSRALPAQLDAGTIDAAFMLDQGRRPGRRFVDSAPLVWVAGPDFTLAPNADVPLVFLTDGRDLRSHAFEALDRVGRRGFIAHTSPDPVGVRAFVMANLAVTVTPDVALTPPLRALGAAEGLPPLSRVQHAYHVGKPTDRAAADALGDILLAQMREERRRLDKRD